MWTKRAKKRSGVDYKRTTKKKYALGKTGDDEEGERRREEEEGEGRGGEGGGGNGWGSGEGDIR